MNARLELRKIPLDLQEYSVKGNPWYELPGRTGRIRLRDDAPMDSLIVEIDELDNVLSDTALIEVDIYGSPVA